MCNAADAAAHPPNGPPALTNTIVSVSDRTGTPEIHVMHGNGDAVRMNATVAGPKSDPVLSPDGKKIVFTAGDNTLGSANPLWVMSSDDTGLKQLTTDGANDMRPTWSPDGSRIAFVSDRDGNTEIYVMNADGTGQTNITNDTTTDDNPAWSPDGNTILFTSSRDSLGSGQSEIYSMSPTGASIVPQRVGYNPEWSPTGLGRPRDQLTRAAPLTAAGPSIVRHRLYAKMYAPSAERLPPATSRTVPARNACGRTMKPTTNTASPTLATHQCRPASWRLCSGCPVKRGSTW